MPKGQRIPTATLLTRHVVRSKSGCLEWAGPLDINGYGTVYVNRVQKKAHRVSWEFHKGAIPRGVLVLHKCDNPKCIEPGHLFLGSHKDNTQDMMAKGRGAVGQRAGAAKLTADEVRVIKTYSKASTHVEIAKQFNVSRQQIGRIRNGVNWNHSSLSHVLNSKL